MTLRDDMLMILRQSRRLLLLVVLVVAPAIYLLSGFYSVGSEERGIVMRFGKVIRDNVPSGMHYHLPWPIEDVRTVSVTALRSMEVDFAAETHPDLQPELTTGDEDLVSVALQVQYNISEPSQYVSTAQNAEDLLRRIATAETLYYISANAIDGLLTTGRTRLQDSLRLDIQEAVSDLELGIRVTSVQIRRLEAPASIKKAFDNVAQARSDRQKLIQESIGQRHTRMAEARTQARRIEQEAQARATEILEQARGDYERFMVNWEEYRKAPAVTGRRLYLEKLEEILGRTQILIVEPDANTTASRR